LGAGGAECVTEGILRVGGDKEAIPLILPSICWRGDDVIAMRLLLKTQAGAMSWQDQEKHRDRSDGRAPGTWRCLRLAVLYARVSTRKQQREGYSIPAQTKLLADYAVLNGIDIVGSPVDVETARKTGRTAFGEMLRHLRRHPEVRIPLVEKTDGLYRNLKDWATIDELGIEVHFVKENTVVSQDCRSSEKFVHGIKVLMAKAYIDNLS